MKMILLIIRIALGLLFVFSGVLKMTDLISFHDTIEQFNILPIQFINAVTILIPSLELVCGLFLTLGLFKKGVISILVPLMTIFIIAISINLYRGAEFDCGCFGPLSIFSTISFSNVLFDILLLILFAVIYMKDNGHVNVKPQFKIPMIYSVLVSFVIYIPFMSTNLKHSIIAKNVQIINWDEAYNFIEEDNAVLFDARPNSRFEKEHVPGAFSLPFNDFIEFYKNHIDLNKSRSILIYCDGLDCNASQRVADKLVQRGFTRVFNIREGWEAWKQKNPKIS